MTTTLEAPAVSALAPPVPRVAPARPFKLIASVMVGPGEIDRYLEPCVNHLMEFCDEIRIRWEQGVEWSAALEGEKVVVLAAGNTFYAHEGRARQELLDFTLAGNPTHILAIDADEFIADGAKLRLHLLTEPMPPVPTAWSVCMQEVWNCTSTGLELREDGGWVEHDVPVVWTPGSLYDGTQPLTLPDRALACGRTPVEMVARAGHTCTAIMHFGWTARHERQPRYDRYVEHDGGRFHAIKHLDSILLPDDRIELWPHPWPHMLLPYREAIEAHAGVVVPPLNPWAVLPPEVKEQLEADIAVHGESYLRIEADGVGVRLDPAAVRASFASYAVRSDDPVD